MTVREESATNSPDVRSATEAPVFPARLRTLETERLLLRPPARADLPHVQRYSIREELYRYLDIDVPTLESVESYLEGLISAWKNPKGRQRSFAIEAKQAGRIAGLIRIAVDADTDDRGNIGYSLDRAFQGRGYATEAAREVVGLAFEELGLSRVWATADTRNDKSWKLLERVGFRREKRMAGHMFIRGTHRDSYLYAIHKS